MNAGSRYEVAVVGAGLIGAAALRHLASAGVRCVGIGPDEPTDFGTHDGPFASHYDSGRITRMIDPQYEWGLLAKRAIANYASIEAASGMTFHSPTGMLYTAKDASEFARLQNTADRLNVEYSVLTADAGVPDSRLALSGSTVFEEAAPAGHINPRVMRVAQLKVARALGADVVRQVAVSAAPIDASVGGRGGWEVRLTDGSTCRAERVLVAAGPHADEFIAPWGRLAYDVRNEAIVTAEIDEAEQTRLAGLPAVIADVEDESTDGCYMVPPTVYPDGSVRIKLGAGLFIGRSLITADDRRRWMRSDEHLEQFPHLKRLLENLVPGLRSSSWSSKPCLIPLTPSRFPYVDHLDEGLVIAAGCNGWAGKSADAIGALAAGLLREGRWSDPDLSESDFRAHFAVG